MIALKAHVENGRVVLDEPMDLPDGTVLSIVPVNDADDLDDEERAELNREIAASIADRKTGAPTYSVEEVLADLGSRR